MGWRKLVAIGLLLGSTALLGSPAFAQQYGVGRPTTADELNRLDISIGRTGAELPVGHGNAKEGAVLFEEKGCSGCHGEAGIGGVNSAPLLHSKFDLSVSPWKREKSILPVLAPFATTVWDFIHRGMPLGGEGTFTVDETYALTAYLLFLNKVIPEDQVLDKESLPKVKMPIGDNYARLPEWKHDSPRLDGYPF